MSAFHGTQTTSSLPHLFGKHSSLSFCLHIVLFLTSCSSFIALLFLALLFKLILQLWCLFFLCPFWLCQAFH